MPRRGTPPDTMPPNPAGRVGPLLAPRRTCGLLPHDAAANPPVAVVRAPCHAAPLLPRAAPPNRWTCHTTPRPFRLRIPCLVSFVHACLMLRHVPLCATYHSAEHCVCPLLHEDGRSAAGERYHRSSEVGCAQHAISQIQPLALSREPPTSGTSLFWLDQECQNEQQPTTSRSPLQASEQRSV